MESDLHPTNFPQLSQQLVDAVRFIGERQWCPATGGNFSARIDEQHCLITQSGKFKDQLTLDDLMISTMDNKAVDPALKPSAETGLHTKLYQLNPQIDCVLHTHSVHSTVLSRACGDKIVIQGYEMQKSLRGNTTHLDSIEVLVFDNDQDIDALAKRVEAKWHAGEITQPGFLVKGHGLYAWGNSVSEAKRHVEGFEFLFACLWQEKLLGKA
ncbi:methylthioribulose 1-phosphate dehydratase [Catenovulum sp. 2E275]|uniref:methylthioribulose 1-phosphate dehydratase n=1 Tax=Catenovulum sp. 2E275 TaxID=2980497 RepID=UPI0021D0A809|nr:methylthioribulose 1-phosphate dehydratase [Catenovulum sp. 2E275]MCU4676042.1 methylthioribulose 1-phosphate dehydratase [Catenovulum sp. 2E275]